MQIRERVGKISEGGGGCRVDRQRAPIPANGGLDVADLLKQESQIIRRREEVSLKRCRHEERFFCGKIVARTTQGLAEIRMIGGLRGVATRGPSEELDRVFETA
jgi:hypothetical protein